jgi:hypothetical protein
MSKFYEVAINPCSSGFGEYEMGEIGGKPWADAEELISECRQNTDVYEIGEDDLPDGLDNINNCTHNARGRFFGWLDSQEEPHYFAIVEMESE